MNEIIIPFGKYKGKPLEAMAEDRQYLDWIQQQGWLAEKYPQINTLIINNFTQPSETPDHNKIQGMFLDGEFCIKFSKAVYESIFKIGKVGKMADILNKINSDVKGISEIIFEHKGVDVLFTISGFDHVKTQESHIDGRWKEVESNANHYIQFVIEIKPSIGDDYPAVLRQIKSNILFNSYGINVLIINEYCGIGISEESFIKLFCSQKIIVVFTKNII